MTALTEGRHTAEFILSEANAKRSRDTGVLLTGNVVVPGQVLGKLLPDMGAADASVGAIVGAGNGTLTMATPAAADDAKEGLWKVQNIEGITDSGAFNVIDPDGIIEGVAAIGVAYTGSIKFTIADGATDFAAGAYFPVTVTRADPTGVGKFVPYDQDGADGSQIAAAISLASYDATDADVPMAVITRDSEVNGNILTWPEDIDAGEKATAVAQLAALGIIVR